MKKKHEEHENHERWLVSYADFITLLFAFFVVMYAVSSVNEGKYRTMSESLVSAFSNHKPMGNLSIIELPFEKRKEVTTTDPPKIKQNVRAYVKIANALQTAKLPEGVMVKSGARGLNIRIADDALFASGSASLRPGVKEFLDLLWVLLRNSLILLRLRGIRTLCRCVPVPSLLIGNCRLLLVRYFTEIRGLDPKRFSATSFAGYRPVESNDTKEGRSANRRVEIIILRHTYAPVPQRNPFLNP